MDVPSRSHCMVDGKLVRRCSSRSFDNFECRSRNSIGCADNPNVRNVHAWIASQATDIRTKGTRRSDKDLMPKVNPALRRDTIDAQHPPDTSQRSTGEEGEGMSAIRFRLIAPAVLLCIVAAASAASGQATGQAPALRSPDVIFVPTPPEVVEAMLKLAKVGPNDVIYDLGSGDGRIPIAAVQTFKARSATGIDIDPQRIKEANENLKKAGVGDRVRFLNQDLFTTPIGEASVVTLYLLQSLNEKLMPKLQKELKPGSRVVSQSFSMGDKWTPDQTVQVQGRNIYLWIIK